MELVERYLHAIRLWLPLGAPRDDILLELSEDIHSEVDERRGSRPSIDEHEVASILKARGHPMAVAARFVTGDSLVGPALYPMLRLVLRIVLGYVLVPVFGLIALATLAASAHPFTAVLHVAFVAMQMLVTSFGTIVLVFALLERQADSAPMLANWDPRKLPKVRDASRVSRWNAIGVAAGGAVMAIIFAVLAIGLPQGIPGLDLASLGGALPGPVWSDFFEKTWRMVVALSLVNFAVGVAMLARPALARAGTGVRAIADALLGTVVLAAVSPHLASISTYRPALVAMGHRLHALPAPASASQIASALGGALDVLVMLTLLAWGAGCLVSALVEGWRYLKLQGRTGKPV
jgi:hypothetical protein